MTLQSKRWQLAPPVSQAHLDRLADLSPLVVQLLHNRGIDDPAAAGAFLSDRAVGHSPFYLKDMDNAVARLLDAVRRQDSIAVYGDYDADGITATALLVQSLTALGAQVRPYIPDRRKEGYGLNIGALRHLYRQGVRLVVTVDCGIRSVDIVRRARQGLDLIITDHHHPLPELPPALAVINPKQPGCPYPFKQLAGVGLAYKLAQALLIMGQPAGLDEEDLVDLVALGTVADLAPLQDENRWLVRRGLARINQDPRPGIEALMAESSLRPGEVDAAGIGFRLGPRLNAAGRLDDAMLGYQLLTSLDPLETRELARRLDQFNRRRQELTEETVAAAEAQVQADDPDAFLYLVASQDFLPGIVGLAASRLTEAYYRPSIVVELGEEKSRGSCRSIPEFHITEALDQCQDLLRSHGGHAAAAGFTIATENLDELRRRLQALAAEELAGQELRPALEIDADIPLEEVDWATHALLSEIEPCGIANPQPVLLSRNVGVQRLRAIGAEGQHLKLGLRDGRGAAWDAVYFRQGRLLDPVPGLVDVAYVLDVNEWNHRKRLQLLVQDLRPAAPPRAGVGQKRLVDNPLET